MRELVLENVYNFRECLHLVLEFFKISSASISMQENKIILKSEEELPEKSAFLEKMKELALTSKKKALEEKINQICNKKILLGFDCDALGSLHHYDTRLEDQINIQALASANLGSFFRCAEVLEDKSHSNKIYKEHTAEQIKSVFNSGLKFKSDLLAFYGKQKEKLASINSLEELEAFKISELE
ncbi:hypothetical protein [Helicobacter pylori]|uniref:hypothetical protein n=1 Tax=Helicobacter pylori TaxID=210 RepID=UPI0004BBEE97|nr:hypothetical protein [Helicobacter pylori]